MAITWTDFTTALGDLLQYPITAAATASPSSSVDFNNILPRCVEYVEGRITKDMDLLATRTVDTTVALTGNSRSAPLPTAVNMFVVQGVNVVTPATATPASGKRNRLIMVSADFIDLAWPVEQGGPLNSVPTYGAILNTTTLIVAPTPDANYPLEYIGTIRLIPLSSAAPSNYISLYYPELYLSCAMIFMSGFTRDYGAQSDDPQKAQSWESQYKTLLGPSQEEEQRRKSQGPNWSPYSATPESKPRP